MEWIETLKAIDYTDPFTLVLYAPVVLGAAYIIFNLWGRRGE